MSIAFFPSLWCYDAIRNGVPSQMIPTTFLSLHDITGLKAVALQSMDTPLVLRVESGDNIFQISLYGLAAAKVECIADAINSIMLEPAPKADLDRMHGIL
jgi:hypothetical protein